jgi:group I intron endonuclease
MQIDIYAIYNDVNGKIYIGQTRRGYKRRFIEHLTPSDGSPLLRKAVKKYGREAFHPELIDIAYSEEEANTLEKLWIKILQTYKHEEGYNLSLGGVIGHFNDEVIQKMKERVGDKNSFYGRHHTEEARRKMSQKKKGMYQGTKHPRAKKVRCIETGEIFDYIKEAAEKKKVNRAHISQACMNQYGRKTAGGYHWEYVEENANNL